jgi:AraC-like DNA-binding protein/quercetin dioxygenase-like cupin family protein
MLKASFEVLHPVSGHSFLVKTFDESGFKAPFHFHPEYELTLITAGSGKRYIGSHMAGFTPGDLVLLGPNLPHCWKLEPADAPATSIVIQFAANCLGQDFFSSAELSAIQRLLKAAQYGIYFPPLVRPLADSGVRFLHKDAIQRIHSLSAEKNDFRRLIGLLELLQELALEKDIVLLDTSGSTAGLTPADRERIHPIFAYLVENFRGPISLEAAAAIAGMSPNAFCRYFKKITRKTFVETVIQHRLDHATRLLIQTNEPVSAICFDSGFGDISHFYKMFRARMHTSPLQHRKNFMQGTKP